MDVSSTTITSCGSRLPRWCRNRDEVSGRLPKSRCNVVACNPESRSRSTVSSWSISSCTASCNLTAALPVGAASAMRSLALPLGSACRANSANSRATVVVLPVPGPPVSTVRPCASAISAASRCSSKPGGKEPVDVRGGPGAGRAAGGQQGQQIVARPVVPRASTCPGTAGCRRRCAAPVAIRAAGWPAPPPASRRPTATAGPATPACSSADGRKSTHTDPPRSAAHQQRHSQRHQRIRLARHRRRVVARRAHPRRRSHRPR